MISLEILLVDNYHSAETASSCQGRAAISPTCDRIRCSGDRKAICEGMYRRRVEVMRAVIRFAKGCIVDDRPLAVTLEAVEVLA
jgi:hypothetical protein